MTQHSTGKERRHFPRVEFRTDAYLLAANKRYPVHVLDLSFNGALVALIHKHKLGEGDEVVLTLEIDPDTKIKMQGRLSHLVEHYLGIECRATNIDHQVKLRELLNNHSVDKHSANRTSDNLMKDYQKGLD